MKMKMKDARDLLLAEYDRLKGLELSYLARYGHALQMYLAVLTAAVGVILLIIQNQDQPKFYALGIGLILSLLLLIGEITYLRLVGHDIALMVIANSRDKIRAQFTNESNDLAEVFPEPWQRNATTYRKWSSIRGIISRAVMVSGHKTAVVLLNSVITASLVCVVTKVNSVWAIVSLGSITTIGSGYLHAAHAQWRYRRLGQSATELTPWWM